LLLCPFFIGRKTLRVFLVSLGVFLSPKLSSFRSRKSTPNAELFFVLQGVFRTVTNQRTPLAITLSNLRRFVYLITEIFREENIRVEHALRFFDNYFSEELEIS